MLHLYNGLILRGVKGEIRGWSDLSVIQLGRDYIDYSPNTKNSPRVYCCYSLLYSVIVCNRELQDTIQMQNKMQGSTQRVEAMADYN